MKQSMRCLVLFGAFALSIPSGLAANSNGPGGNDPPPPAPVMTTNTASTGMIAVLLAYLGL